LALSHYERLSVVVFASICHKKALEQFNWHKSATGDRVYGTITILRKIGRIDHKIDSTNPTTVATAHIRTVDEIT
jgi:hypothetical protein